MTVNRRDFMKPNAAAAAAAAAGISLPAAPAAAQTAGADKIRWDKAACRFCGTGCGVLVGVQDGRVVATQGDPEAEVNRGLNCVKGYFLAKIMYGADRLKTPLLRKKDGRYDKNGEFTPVSWKEAFDVMAEKWKDGAPQGRSDHGRHVRLGPVDGVGGLRRGEALQGRVPLEQPRPERAPLHGLRGHRVHAQLRHGRADGLLRRLRARRRVRHVGLEHGRDAPGALDPDHRPAPAAPAREGRGALDLPAPRPRAGRPAHDLHAEHRPRDPQLHRAPHHQHRAREQGVRVEERQLRARQRRHRLRPAAGGSARAEMRRTRRTRRR